jgi:hypothetical protein
LSRPSPSKNLQRKRLLLALSLALVIVFRASAYDVLLTPAEIHEAFTLGQRNDAATASFLAPYIKELATEGASGPHIAEVEILTPFAQIVDQSCQNMTNGYTQQQAESDYHQRGDIVEVRVVLMLPAAYPKQDDNQAPQANANKNTALRPENFWQNFQFAVKQHGKMIPSRSIHNRPIYSTATKDAPAVLDGATVVLEYDAKDIGSESTEVDAVTPDAKTISATFELKKVR